MAAPEEEPYQTPEDRCARARRLLEPDLRELPTATLAQRREYMRIVAGLGVSESTVSRTLRRMGRTRKKNR